MTREITHMKAFMLALDSMGKDPLPIGKIPPTPGLVDQYFNDSTGEGDFGENECAARGTRATAGSSWKHPHSGNLNRRSPARDGPWIRKKNSNQPPAGDARAEYEPLKSESPLPGMQRWFI